MKANDQSLLFDLGGGIIGSAYCSNVEGESSVGYTISETILGRLKYRLNAAATIILVSKIGAATIRN